MEGGELFNRIQEKKSFTEKGEWFKIEIQIIIVKILNTSFLFANPIDTLQFKNFAIILTTS